MFVFTNIFHSVELFPLFWLSTNTYFVLSLFRHEKSWVHNILKKIIFSSYFFSWNFGHFVQLLFDSPLVNLNQFGSFWLYLQLILRNTFQNGTTHSKSSFGMFPFSYLVLRMEYDGFMNAKIARLIVSTQHHFKSFTIQHPILSIYLHKTYYYIIISIFFFCSFEKCVSCEWAAYIGIIQLGIYLSCVQSTFKINPSIDSIIEQDTRAARTKHNSLVTHNFSTVCCRYLDVQVLHMNMNITARIHNIYQFIFIIFLSKQNSMNFQH